MSEASPQAGGHEPLCGAPNEEPESPGPAPFHPSASSATGRLPWGLCGMVCLMLTAESFVGRHAHEITPWGTWAWRFSGEAVFKQSQQRDVLCFGDSLVKLGVLPPVIERRSGLRAYNLAVCAAQAPASYFLLRRAINAGARPQAVIVDFKSDMLAGGPRDFARNWPELLTLRECIELSWAAHDPRFFASTALSLFLPSVRARHDVRIWILLALQGNSSHLRASTIAYDRNWKLNEGAQATASNRAYQGDIDPQLKRKLLLHVFWCNRVNRVYIRRFLALARAHHIRVFWLLPPTARVVQQERERSGADAGYEKFLRGFAERDPNLIVVDGRHAGYHHTLLIDPVHLDRRGATALSTELAALLGQSVNREWQGPRWITLPPYREPQDDIALSEINDSNVAARMEAGSVRR